MREVNCQLIRNAVADLCRQSNFELPGDVVAALKEARRQETSDLCRWALKQILENAEIARRESVAICQDTGVATVFVELGQEVKITGGGLRDAVDEGVRRGYRDGFLRKSLVDHPLRRENTRDNTPADLHVDLVEGDQVTVQFMPKGAGSENMSRIAMLSPADGPEGVRSFVVETVRRAGANACPPMVVGVGLGGTFDSAPVLAKRALFSPLDRENEDDFLAEMERDILRAINDTGIGAAGFGGQITALSVNIEVEACHIASLPVAVNLQCHACRRAEVTI